MNEQTVLFDLLKEGVSPAHVVKSCEKRLEDAGFEKIAYEKEWNLKAGGRYYVDHHDTTLFAFTIPEDEMKKEEKPAVRIAAAHTDFPCLRIKPSCDVVTNRYAQVNIEVYGGAILNTWLDRPLGVAGRVAVRGNDPFVPEMKYFASEKNLLTIPNLNLISFCQTGRRIFFPNFIVQLMQIRYNYFIKQLFSARCFLERSSQKSQ